MWPSCIEDLGGNLTEPIHLNRWLFPVIVYIWCVCCLLTPDFFLFYCSTMFLFFFLFAYQVSSRFHVGRSPVIFFGWPWPLVLMRLTFGIGLVIYNELSVLVLRLYVVYRYYEWMFNVIWFETWNKTSVVVIVWRKRFQPSSRHFYFKLRRFSSAAYISVTSDVSSKLLFVCVFYESIVNFK